MTNLYRIRDWNEHFETHETRKLKSLKWLPIPNKQDGDGYTELIDHPNGFAHLGVWNALLQLASKCRERGTLSRDTGKSPHDFGSISRITRIPVKLLEEAVPRLLQIGWLEVVELDPPVSPDAPGDFPGSPGSSPGNLPLKGREGKGKEGKGGKVPAPTGFSLLDKEIQERLAPLREAGVNLEANDSTLGEWVRDTHGLTRVCVAAIVANEIPVWPSDFRRLRDAWRSTRPKEIEKPIPMRVRTKAVRNDDGTTTIYYSDGTSENHSNTKVST